MPKFPYTLYEYTPQQIGKTSQYRVVRLKFSITGPHPKDKIFISKSTVLDHVGLRAAENYVIRKNFKR